MENPTTEMVTAVCVVNHKLLNKLEKLPYLKDIEAFKVCIETLKTVNTSLEQLAKTVGEVSNALVIFIIG